MTAETILELAGELEKKVAARGFLVLSGILPQKAAAIRALFAARFRVVKRKRSRRVGDLAAATKMTQPWLVSSCRKKISRTSAASIDGQELVHLRKVLRLAPGDRITVFDDAGWEHEAVIRALAAAQGEIEILRSYEPATRFGFANYLAAGLTKGEKIDFVVEKATELGAQTHRSVHFDVFGAETGRAKNCRAHRRAGAKIALERGQAMRQDACAGNFAAARLSDASQAAIRRECVKLFFWEKESESIIGGSARKPSAR